MCKTYLNSLLLFASFIRFHGSSDGVGLLSVAYVGCETDKCQGSAAI